METEVEHLAQKPKRRWFQFSLATLLLLTLACAVVFGLWRAAAERQRRAVKYIESRNGSVRFAIDDGLHKPRWLRQSVGTHYLSSVEVVDLSDTQVSDAGLANLQGLPALKVLHLSDTQVSDAGLAHLQRLPELEWLTLSRTQVSGAGLVHLQSLPALVRLDLDGTQVSDAGLAYLQGLTALKVLHLSDVQVSDAGLAHLERLTELDYLSRPAIEVKRFLELG